MTTAFQPSAQPDFVERRREYQRAYYLAHREERIAYQRTYLSENRDAINEGRRIKRPSKVQARGILHTSKTEYNRRYHCEVQAEANLRLRIKALQVVSGLRCPVCVRCGEADIFVLAINHKNGGGRQEVKNNAFGWWKGIISGQRGVNDLDVRCHNCNIRYEYERGRRNLPRDWEAVIKDATK